MAHMVETLDPVPSVNHAQSTRMRALWVPREHGAWGMLLVPLVTGATVAAGGSRNYIALTWFTIAALSLFWLRTPVESLLGASAMRVRNAEERRRVLIAIGLISLVSLFALISLFWRFQNLGLILVGIGAGMAFGAQAVLKNRGRNYRAIAQVIGSIGLTSTAASAYYVVTGKLDSLGLTLWAVNWLFASEQIEFVQMRILGARLENARDRFRRGKSYLVTLTAIIATITLLSIIEITPPLTIVAFVPPVIRAGAWFISKTSALNVHKLGWLELANAMVFALILVVAFRMF